MCQLTHVRYFTSEINAWKRCLNHAETNEIQQIKVNIDYNEKISSKSLPQEIIVKTNDSVRYSHILKLCIENSIPLLFCGPTGTGKSIYIKNFILNDLPADKFSSI